MLVSYIHPVLSALVLALLAYVASLGARSRSDRRRRALYLARHRRLAPWMYAAFVASWFGGLASTWLTRPEEDLAAGWHFRLGVAMVVLLTGSAITARNMDREAVRSLHPWFGAAAMLVSAGQIFFGLRFLP
jgi:Na+/proline symporter